jgi:hypothetical protein
MKARACVHRAAGRAGRPCAWLTWLTLLPGAALLDAWVGAWADALPQTTEDIHDIRGPKIVPGSHVVPVVIAVAVFVALLAFAIWHRRRRTVTRRVLTLAERTLERLDGTRPLMRPETARTFGIAASEVIRDYIEQRFDVVATQRTTEEFLQALLQGSNEALARHRALLAEFLQQCDFVKFAGDALTVPDMESLYSSARSFVLETGEAIAA